jgi:hypothetical protein
MRSLLGVAHLRRDTGAARQVGVLGTPLMRESEDVAEGERCRQATSTRAAAQR